ncbi:MAG: EF-P lysine aminoacylase GenX [Pseudomonadota bacterium]|nr:MAG: EF-P lysine aminoacylase GenX [Pseudomonadota bacterium]
MSSGDWRPSAVLETLRLRAVLFARLRAFFAARGVLEIETPLLSRAAVTEPHLASFVVSEPVGTQGPLRYLQTSPEYAMKRLLAAGSGPIYQICKAFRAGEVGRRHNPEFTMVEWYRPGLDHQQLMEEVAALLGALLAGYVECAAPQCVSYQEIFRRHAGVDPLAAGVSELRAAAQHHGVDAVAGLTAEDRDGWLDLLLTQVIEPCLPAGPLFVYDYPASQAALARLNSQDERVAERFELYFNGLELANGFNELCDPAQQRSRFARDQQRRRAAGLAAVPIDEHLLDALEHGLPAGAGVAVGFDRVVMLAAGASHINQVLAFPDERA